MSVGALLTVGMMMARAQLPWFPFHPIGYMMANCMPGSRFWFSIFVGWSAKKLIVRFGGANAYRANLPFFLGLALGDVAMILFWLVVDGWQGRTGHQLMPG